ncbi:hypothetical protein [Yokenella regensburgei]|uniref:hypothetical protein n=1 Tax=Yokenella regensburgei TaxID=158877 RepID=UPI003EDAB8B7
MMSLVIVNGDVILFFPQFGVRIITLPVTTIPGSGHATIGVKKVCVKGDEKKVKLQTPYISGAYTTPGLAEITIKKLDSGQLASNCISPDDLITQGQQPFDAQLKVLTPATTPPPTVTPDNTIPSDGKGIFIPSQFWVSAG